MWQNEECLDLKWGTAAVGGGVVEGSKRVRDPRTTSMEALVFCFKGSKSF